MQRLFKFINNFFQNFFTAKPKNRKIGKFRLYFAELNSTNFKVSYGTVKKKRKT